jgi:hypothetical protein
MARPLRIESDGACIASPCEVTSARQSSLTRRIEAFSEIRQFHRPSRGYATPRSSPTAWVALFDDQSADKIRLPSSTGKPWRPDRQRTLPPGEGSGACPQQQHCHYDDRCDFPECRLDITPALFPKIRLVHPFPPCVCLLRLSKATEQRLCHPGKSLRARHSARTQCLPRPALAYINPSGAKSGSLHQ